MILSIGRNKSSLICNPKGFTLIEILLVVALLSIITGFSVPKFRNTFSYIRLKKTAEEMAYVMRYARGRAITGGQPIQLEFDSSQSQYWLTEGVDSEDSDTLEFQRISGRMGKSFIIPDNYRLEFEELVMNFNLDGTMDKRSVQLCQKEKCYVVSTKEQRGTVRVFIIEAEE